MLTAATWLIVAIAMALLCRSAVLAIAVLRDRN